MAGAEGRDKVRVHKRRVTRGRFVMPWGRSKRRRLRIVELDEGALERPEILVTLRRLWEEAAGLLVLREPSSSPSKVRALSVARAMGTPRRSMAGAPVSIDSVDQVYEIRPRRGGTGLTDGRGVTVTSTTFADFHLHSDGYNADPSPDLILMQCVTAGKGGTNSFRSISDLVATVTPATVDAMQDPVFPTQHGTAALLVRTPTPSGEPSWSGLVNLYEIEAHVERDHNCSALEDRHRTAIGELSLRVVAARSDTRVHLQPGDIALVDNRRYLHARSSLEPGDDQRLVHRVWVDLD